MRRPFDPLQVLMAVIHELFVCDLMLCDIAPVRHVSAEQHNRLRLAAVRLSAAMAAIGQQPVPEEIRQHSLAAA